MEKAPPTMGGYDLGKLVGGHEEDVASVHPGDLLKGGGVGQGVEGEGPAR